jgi:hypothetical protein
MKTKVKIIKNNPNTPLIFANVGDIGYIDGYGLTKDGTPIAYVIIPRVKRIEVLDMFQIEVIEVGE